MAFLKRNKRPARISQNRLPAGIAYGWYFFAYSSVGINSDHYVHGVEGASLALIPVRDWDKVPDGTELVDTHGDVFIKGETDLLPYRHSVSGGYYGLGFLMVGRPIFFRRLPTEICLKCHILGVVRQEVEPSLDGTRWDRVVCLSCDMWWIEPYSDDPEDRRPLARYETVGRRVDEIDAVRAVLVRAHLDAVP